MAAGLQAIYTVVTVIVISMELGLEDMCGYPLSSRIINRKLCGLFHGVLMWKRENGKITKEQNCKKKTRCFHQNTEYSGSFKLSFYIPKKMIFASPLSNSAFITALSLLSYSTCTLSVAQNSLQT